MAGGHGKQEKQLFPLPPHFMNRYCLSRKIPIEREKKQERKKEKITNRTQTKPNAPHVMYNVKILSQLLIIPDK